MRCQRSKQQILVPLGRVGSSAGERRHELEQAIDMFEHTMSAGQPEMFHFARQGLIIILEELGFKYDESDVEET